MVKLVIQIPCLNEEHTLPGTVAALPRSLDGIDQVEFLVIDDGCSDRTVDVARSLGVDHIHSHTSNQGLGRAFRSGLEQALILGADIIVNTDGDGQYAGEDIAALVKPILEERADIVIGDRRPASNPEFGYGKRALQWFGSHVVKQLSGANVPDAVSGFRAISRDSALKLNILSQFSYTVEMIIQAANKQMNVVSVPVRTNPKTRESRLFNNIPQFVARHVVGMIRMYAMYRPMRFFFTLGTILSLLGLMPITKFVFYYFSGDGEGHIQSLVLGGALLSMGFMVFVTGLLSDLISQNRQLIEIALEKARGLELHDKDRSDTVADSKSR
jgi:glycosyltransferase involved in cell wall biosynthesis